MDELLKNQGLPEDVPSEDTYRSIRGYVIEAQRQVYTAVNTAMVNAYWNIGKAIFELCGENDRAAYGKQVLKHLAELLTAEFGKGFSVQGLRNMRQFYLAFPIRSTVWSELERCSKIAAYCVIPEH